MLFHLAQSELSLCVSQMMTVPFVSYGHHNRNGVVFCVCGEDVYATCMDCECIGRLAKRREAFLVMSRYFIQLHLFVIFAYVKVLILCCTSGLLYPFCDYEIKQRIGDHLLEIVGLIPTASKFRLQDVILFSDYLVQRGGSLLVRGRKETQGHGGLCKLRG